MTIVIDASMELERSQGRALAELLLTRNDLVGKTVRLVSRVHEADGLLAGVSEGLFVRGAIVKIGVNWTFRTESERPSYASSGVFQEPAEEVDRLVLLLPSFPELSLAKFLLQWARAGTASDTIVLSPELDQDFIEALEDSAAAGGDLIVVAGTIKPATKGRHRHAPELAASRAHYHGIPSFVLDIGQFSRNERERLHMQAITPAS